MVGLARVSTGGVLFVQLAEQGIQIEDHLVHQPLLFKNLLSYIAAGSCIMYHAYNCLSLKTLL